MQCACEALLSGACPALQKFSKLPQKQHDFRQQNYAFHIFSFGFFLAYQMFSYYYLNFCSYDVSVATIRETVVLPTTARTSVTDAMEHCVITICLSVYTHGKKFGSQWNDFRKI